MRKFASKPFVAALLTGTALYASAPAFADAATAAPVAAASDEPGAIIVTARRRSETLQSTPVAITAINIQMLQNKAAVNLADLQGAAPGLLITQQNSGAAAANLSIRGLTYADVEKSQTPTVGVVVDGVTIGTSTGQLQDVFDVAQIEVLRGPQGTLFGANTIGGVINITRSKPTMEPGAKIEFSYGQWNTWSGKGIVNYGNGSSWGVKAWYFHNQTDGYYFNAALGHRSGGSKDDNFGTALLFKPAGSGFDAQLTLEDMVSSFTPVNSILAADGSDSFCTYKLLPAAACGRNKTTGLYTVFDQPTYSHYHAPAATLSMNLDLGFTKLTSVTGWRHTHEEQTQDYGTDGVYYALRKQHYTQWSEELRAAGSVIKAVDYVVGGYFFDSRYDLTQWTGGPALYDTTDPSATAPGQQVVHGHTRSFAGFGDFNWTIVPKVRLSFGGRYSHDQKQLDNGFYSVVDGMEGAFGLIGSGNANFSKFTPKVGLDWRPTSDMLFYTSWSRGYRSGGFSSRASTAATASTPFQPETVDAYEVGAKLSTPDHRGTLDLAGFISNYKNLQQNTTIPGGPTGNQTTTTNVGGAVIRGIEMDAAYSVTSQFKITATAALTESHFRGFVAGNTCPAGDTCPTAVNNVVQYDYSANHLIYAPTFSGSLNGVYTAPTEFGNIVTSVGWRHISPYDEQISVNGTPVLNAAGNYVVNGNDPRVRTVTQDLVDASVTANFKLHGADAYLRVFGRNLADARTTTASFTVAGAWTFASALEPRTYGATVGVKF